MLPRLGDGRPVVNRAGFFKIDQNTGQREFYIMREAWKEVCAGIDPRRTARLLVDRGLLRRDADGGATCPVRLPTIGRMRAYVVLPAIFTDSDG